MSDDIAASSAVASGDTSSESSTAPAIEASQSGEVRSETLVTGTSNAGEPPRERWPDILENARKKAREEADAAWQPHAWAREVDPNQFRQMQTWYQNAISDTPGFYERMTEELQRHPEYGSRVRSIAARVLQQSRQQGLEDTEPEPDVPIVNANGEITGRTYSAEQLKKVRAYERQQYKQELDQELRPLKAMREEQEQQRAMSKLQQESAEWAKGTLAELRADPTFKEREADVKKAMLANPKWDIYRAYTHVLRTQVEPSIEAKTVATLQQKAAAGTVGTRSPSAGTRPALKNFAEAMRYYDAHPDEAAAMAER